MDSRGEAKESRRGVINDTNNKNKNNGPGVLEHTPKTEQDGQFNHNEKVNCKQEHGGEHELEQVQQPKPGPQEAENVEFRNIVNDGRSESLILLTKLKNIFQRQLPKMPKDYITRLVFDKKHNSLAIVRNSSMVIGGITYRMFEHRGFVEIVFCAVSSVEQVKGYGSKLMNTLKDYIQDTSTAKTFLTYADNYAIGYFKKQGFTKEITFDKKLWMGYIKDYEGGTLMQCTMIDKIRYSEVRKILDLQKQTVLEKIRSLSKSHIVYPGLGKRFKFPVEDPYKIPGVSESGWLPEMDERGRADSKSKLLTWQSNVVSEMQVNPNAWAFLQPVDIVEVPDYKLHIKTPMDLSTLEKNVDRGKYSDLDSFVADVMLIFNNAREYNGETSRYGRCATMLQRFFEEKLSEFKVKCQLNAPQQ